MGNAFAPLGVYINFWQPTLNARSKQTFTVMLVNDDDTATTGELSLVLENERGVSLSQKKEPFAVAALGQTTLLVDFEVPAGRGKCTLKAIAQPLTGKEHEATISRRWVKLVTGAAANSHN